MTKKILEQIAPQIISTFDTALAYVKQLEEENAELKAHVQAERHLVRELYMSIHVSTLNKYSDQIKNLWIAAKERGELADYSPNEVVESVPD